MVSKEQLILNGNFITVQEQDFFTQNRAFLYGDSIFETMRVHNRTILHFDEHMNRLVLGMKVLKYEIPDKFTIFRQKLEDEIIQLLNKNKIFKSSRLRLTVYRKSGGFYTPENNKIDYLIQVAKLEQDEFKLNKNGLVLGIYDEIKKPINAFSQFKTANSLIYILAGIYKNSKGYDDCLIQNEKNHIIEAVSSNIFIVKNKALYTPCISEGCINGIMRNTIIHYAKKMNIPVVEQIILPEDLLKADEVFLSNSISGIQWVVAFKQKRYFKKTSEFFIKQLNDNFS